jgi:ABC-type transporter Mla subunit MlaD
VRDSSQPSPELAPANGVPRCEPQIEDELVIVEEVNAFVKAAGADLQALHAAVTRFVVHCRDRGEPIERIITTLKSVIAGAVRGDTDVRAVNAINQHLLSWVLDAYYTHER